MTNVFDDVKLFMETGGQLTEGAEKVIPHWPSMEIIRLRKDLINEEFGEILSAINIKDLVGVADGLIDLLYVTVGALISFGFPGEELFAEVQRSNMSKFIGGVIKNEKGKVMKGPNYSPPDLKSIIEKQSKKQERQK